MGTIRMFAWILLNIYYICAQKEKTTSVNSYCKTSKSDIICGAPKDCCPNGWILIGETCYYYEQREQKSLIEAGKHCKELNASIFVPNSLEELQNVFQHASKYTWTWIGVRKENEVKPQVDNRGNMSMSTLNWNKSPYVEEYANVSLFMCDGFYPVKEHGFSAYMLTCGQELLYICERSPQPESGETDQTASPALLTWVDIGAPEPKSSDDDLLERWHFMVSPYDDEQEGRIVPAEEMRKTQAELTTQRINLEESLLEKAQSGKEDDKYYEFYVNLTALQYMFQASLLRRIRQAYELKLRQLGQLTRNLNIDIKNVEMNLKGNVSSYEEQFETLRKSKSSFCATLRKLKKEIYLKSVTKEEN